MNAGKEGVNAGAAAESDRVLLFIDVGGASLLATDGMNAGLLVTSCCMLGLCGEMKMASLLLLGFF